MQSPAPVIRHGQEFGSPGNLNCPVTFQQLHRKLRRRGQHYYSMPELLDKGEVALEVRWNGEQITEYQFKFELPLHLTLPSLLTLVFIEGDSAHMCGAIYHPLDNVIEAFDPSGPSRPTIALLLLLGKHLSCTDIRWSTTILLQQGDHRDDLCVVYTFVLLLVRIFTPWEQWNRFVLELRCIGLSERSYLIKKCYELLLLEKNQPMDLCAALVRETHDRWEDVEGNCVDEIGTVKPERLYFKPTVDADLDQLIAHHLANPDAVQWHPLQRFENVTVRKKRR